MNRQAVLDHLRQEPERDVLIIGAGVNGLGTFRDLALQGIRVLVIDRADFCAGASAASSHMVHGGVRYLENGEFRLVREAVQERNRLLANAPHYVKPLPTTFPIFKWTSGLLNAPLKFIGWLDKPAERGAIVLKAGLSLYDGYTQGKSPVPAHAFRLRRKSLEKYPDLNPNIVCTATYYDAAMFTPERICLEVMLDGEEASPQAKAINYVSAVKTKGDHIILRDEVSGDTFAIKPKVVINAAGPWVDFTNQNLGQKTQFIGGTKGSHLILDHPELRQAIADHEFFFENKDGRIVLLYPLLDKVLVGTSDIAIDNPDQARCTDEEIDYFLSLIRYVFPAIPVKRSDIVFQFSGVRPLPNSQANTTGQISRDHSIQILESNKTQAFPIYNLIGGKWTTFRAFSEQATDLVLDRLGQSRQRDTKSRPFGGGRDYPCGERRQNMWLQEKAQAAELSLAQMHLLFERYGTRAAEIARFMNADSDAPLQHQPTYSRREVQFLATHEKVVHLDDFILRRSMLGMLGHVTPDLLHELGSIIGETLIWSSNVQAAEVQRTLTILADRHGVQFT